MELRNALFLLVMFTYCIGAFFFVKRFSHHIWSYFLTGVLYIPFFLYVGFKMCYNIGTGAMLCVSRGVGMERGMAPRLRFLCRPELVFIDVLPAPMTQ